MSLNNYECDGQLNLFDMFKSLVTLPINTKSAKVLSLFDGMACAMLTLLGCGVGIDRYVAYEIDKYAVKTSAHNFPMIKHKGDVFNADFAEYEGFDLLMGGSPCTYWSIAQTKNRETVASGMGWELFSQYVRALNEAKPKAFIYENNKSMSNAIRQSICETFGFEPICINSALVSAQNRNRLYWVGIRTGDGTYKKVDVMQPEDRGILLKDILETGTTWLDKSRTIDASYCRGGNTNLAKQSGKRIMAAEPIKSLKDKEMEYMLKDHQDRRWNFANRPGQDAKAKVVVANMCKGVPYNVICEPIRVGTFDNRKGEPSISQASRIYSVDGKAVTISTGKTKTGWYAQPLCVAERGRYDENGNVYQHLEVNETGKTNTITTVQKDNQVIEPISIDNAKDFKSSENYLQYDINGNGNCSQDQRIRYPDSKSGTLTSNGTQSKIKIFDPVPECFKVAEATKKGHADIEPGDCVDMAQPNSKTRRGRLMGKGGEK